MLDKDIREPLFDYLDERYGKVRTIEEKIIGKSRADVLAIVEGEIIGFEIKSDNDTYARLKRQIKDYEHFCNRCYVVVGESHIHVSEHIPDYWGIIVVNNENVIVDRDAAQCPKVKIFDQLDLVDRDAAQCPKVKIFDQLDLLWRNELSNIQEKEGLPKLANKRRREIYQRLIRDISETYRQGWRRTN